VNDVELESTPLTATAAEHCPVDSCARAIRRLSKGLVPSFTLRALLERIPPASSRGVRRLLETDPARRVKLKIATKAREDAPCDIADIVEDLAPAEREAVFETIDEEVAAETLESSIPTSSLGGRIAGQGSGGRYRRGDGPDAAADLLANLTEERSDAILEEMQPAERREVTQLLEFGEQPAPDA